MFHFQDLEYKKYFKLVAKTLHFPKSKKQFKSRFFHFLNSESYILKYKKFARVSVYVGVDFFLFFKLGIKSSVSGNMRGFLVKYKRMLGWEGVGGEASVS